MLGCALEHDAPAVLAQVQLADAQRGGGELEFGDGEQVLGRVGQQAEAVDHLHLQVAQFIGVAARC